MAKTVTISLRITPELKEKLQAAAEADRRSMSQFIEIVLEERVAAPAKSSRSR